MLYVQHWSFKAGFHQKGAEKFLGGGGDYPGVEMIGRYHAPGSLEGWIVLKTSDPKAIYQHAAEWGEFLNWETTPVFTCLLYTSPSPRDRQKYRMPSSA